MYLYFLVAPLEKMKLLMEMFYSNFVFEIIFFTFLFFWCLWISQYHYVTLYLSCKLVKRLLTLSCSVYVTVSLCCLLYVLELIKYCCKYLSFPFSFNWCMSLYHLFCLWMFICHCVTHSISWNWLHSCCPFVYRLLFLNKQNACFPCFFCLLSLCHCVFWSLSWN